MPAHIKCTCGYGLREEDGKLVLRSHTLDCPALRRIVEIERSGVCAQCGERKLVERDGQIIRCPNGCSFEMKGEAMLEVLDSSGSGWIRDVLADAATMEFRRGFPDD